jgi:hypothetical protein
MPKSDDATTKSNSGVGAMTETSTISTTTSAIATTTNTDDTTVEAVPVKLRVESNKVIDDNGIVMKSSNSAVVVIDKQHHSSEDASALLLDRLRHNAKLHPKKRAMAFITSASSSSSTASAASTSSTTLSHKVKMEREISYAELEYETDRLALSLLNEHKIAKGDRYVASGFIYLSLSLCE